MKVTVLPGIDLSETLNNGEYNPRLYLNSQDCRPKSFYSVLGIRDITDWVNIISGKSPVNEKNQLIPMSEAITIGIGELYIVNNAFDYYGVIGIEFNISDIIECIELYIQNVIGEDPEGTIYIWTPLVYTVANNFNTLVKRVTALKHSDSIEVVFLIDEITLKQPIDMRASKLS